MYRFACAASRNFLKIEQQQILYMLSLKTSRIALICSPHQTK